MKKTININLGGHPFIIDLDAYDSLERYLNSLRKYFKGHEGSDEILDDIELRIAELFHEELKTHKIVSQKNIESIIATMGTIADLGDAEDATTESSKSYTTNSSTYITGKRLFRNEDNKILGGVASGLAAYFGIENPWWIRVPFLIFIGAGSPFLYLILWIFVSSAKTSSDRLAMQGEPININNIVKTIEEEISTLKDKIEDIGRDLSKKN